MQKLAFIDVETTGVNEHNCGIIQVGCIITDIHLNELDKLDISMRPLPTDVFEPEALEKTGLTIEEINACPFSSKEGFNMLKDFLDDNVSRYDKKDKLQFVAYNSQFDERFIRKWFYRNNDDFYGSYFWNPSICLMKEAAYRLRKSRESFPSFKLETICQAVGIEWDESKAHNAFYDIQKTVELYKFFDE